ncbi:MAG: mandelate racemase/muconate lactonizing enzyme family protein [Bacteroidota bacterium]
MKIAQITAHEVIVPAKAGTIDSAGINKALHKLPVGAKGGWSVQFDQLPKIILKMELDDGIIAWGELYRGHNWQVVEEIAQSLVGRSLKEFSLQRLPFTYCREYDGFECAIWDAWAKSHNMRLVDILGGPIREQVRVGAWSSHRDKEEIGDLARTFAQRGFDCVKFKTDLSDDVAFWCAEIQRVAPEMEVILDPNERWLYPGEARKRIDALAEVGNVLCLEDPLPRWKLNEYALLRTYGSVPIALHVSLPYILHGQRVKDAIQALEAQAVDGFNFNGGLARFQQLAHIAEAAGLPFWHGSEVDLGILEAMYVHQSAAAVNCVWPGDIFGRLIREHDLLKAPLDIQPPYVNLPQGPGIGVEPDEAAIRNYEVQKRQWR